MAPTRCRAAGAFALLALLLAAGPSAPVAAEDEPVAVDWVADDAACRCTAGNACWHFLRAPVEPSADVCWCNFCTKTSKHDGTRPMPAGWSEICASNGKMDCFLRRHAESWSIACSDCLRPEKCCNNPHPGACPRCESNAPDAMAEMKKEIEFRWKRESALFANAGTVIACSPHFYVVSDIPSLKIRTQGGSYRVIGTHELVHVYAERAEKAYREFCRHLGAEVTLSKPAAIFLPKRASTGEKIQARYNSSAKTNLVYGGSADGRIADGFCFNGFCAKQGGGDDVGLHHEVRHQVGHLLISCWTKVDGQNRVLPRWMFEGAAHWLAKRHPLLRDEVVWCADEGSPLSGSGKGWENDARKVAADPKTVPVERLLAKSTIGLLEFEDHVRSWSYFELGLAEDREGFVKVLRNLRNEMSPRQAWMDAMGCTPEEWDQRWKDRVLGRRPTLGPLPTDAAGDEGPGAADRRAIRNEMDMQNLVARIRSIGVCADPRTAAVLVEQFARESEAVREALCVLLAKTQDPPTVEAIRKAGLGHAHPMIRAYAARVLGLLGDAGALDGLRLQVEDAFWMARAEAALALMRVRDPKIHESVRPLLEDGSAKVRIAALDAIGSSGKLGERVVSLVARSLDHENWQVRSAACESLGGIGAMTGVDPLIARMTTEAGRIRRDCFEALKKVTKDDFGMNPENWATWWKRQKQRVGGLPQAPGDQPVPEVNPEDLRYGVRKPPVYGMQVFSDRIGYVLDMSNSMFNLFEPDAAEMKKLRRQYKGANKFDISREEIVQSIQGLDPRAKFTVMVFSNRPRTMGNELVPAVPENAKKAEGFLRACRSAPGAGGAAQMTSFYDAFRAVLNLPPGSVPPGNLQETPDTMFFLTDGEPTLGEIIDSDELLAWFTGLNRYARIRVHVIAYGNLGIDIPFLSGLATQNGGEFINIHEARQASDAPSSTPK